MKFNPPKIKVLSPKQKSYDTDKDGVPDYKDCRPFNPLLQHVKPNILMAKRINALPLYVSSKAHSKEYHVLSRKAKTVPKARIELLSTLKEYPSLIGDIERAPKPKKYVHRHSQRSHLPGRLRLRYQGSMFDPETREDVIASMPSDLYEKRTQELEEELQDKQEVWAPPRNQFVTISLPEDREFAEMLEQRAYYKQQPYAMEGIRPSSYRGPYTGDKQTSNYVKVISKGSHSQYILYFLSKRNFARWSEIASITGIDDKPLGKLLHAMQNTGLITHPSRGIYKITSLGRNIHDYVNEKGTWRYKDTVVPRGVVKGWPDTDQEQRITVVSEYSGRGKIPYNIMKVITEIGISGVARWNEIQACTDVGEQHFSQTLRRMEQTGLITRPRPGEYKLTTKGKNVLRKVREEGIWKA